MPGITAAHLLRHTLHEDIFYPEHPPREETEEYKKVHHHLIVELDAPCYICGIRNSELGDVSVNTHGVKQMETHHLLEWALIDALSPSKVAHQFDLPPDRVQAFLDHGYGNLMVLCDRHHRHEEVGIHELSYPIWLAQKFLRDDYTLTIDHSKAGETK